MKHKQLMILIPTIMILAIGIRAVVKGINPREQVYAFTVNDYKMVRSNKRSERRNEKAFSLFIHNLSVADISSRRYSLHSKER